MPSKRAVLQQFKRDELLAAVDRFGLEVHDRRVRDQLVDALAGSRKAHLADILGDMSRDQLKEICRALDLDDSGREKSVLIARLAGTAAPAAAESRTLSALRDTLLPKLISGELRVQDAERFIEGLSDG